MNLSALQSSSNLNQLMVQSFVFQTIVTTQASWFMPQLALTPHKLEHFKGAVHNDPTRLSTVSDYPVLICSCSSSKKKKKDISPTNSNLKNLTGIFPLYFAYLNADLLIPQASVEYKIINSSVNFIHFIT